MNTLTALSEPTGSKRMVPSEFSEDKDMCAWMEAQDSPTGTNTFETWIDWEGIERHVTRLQRQLANAVEHGNRKAARHYKKLIRSSQHVKMLAIRMVTQENQGRKTPGVDDRIFMTPKARQELLTWVNPRKKPSPVRRVYIRKKNGKQRPLGIPTIHDRVCQIMRKMAMEPEWDIQFESNSYGFRMLEAIEIGIEILTQGQCDALAISYNSAHAILSRDVRHDVGANFAHCERDIKGIWFLYTQKWYLLRACHHRVSGV